MCWVLEISKTVSSDVERGGEGACQGETRNTGPLNVLDFPPSVLCVLFMQGLFALQLWCFLVCVGGGPISH